MVLAHGGGRGAEGRERQGLEAAGDGKRDGEVEEWEAWDGSGVRVGVRGESGRRKWGKWVEDRWVLCSSGLQWWASFAGLGESLLCSATTSSAWHSRGNGVHAGGAGHAEASKSWSGGGIVLRERGCQRGS